MNVATGEQARHRSGIRMQSHWRQSWKSITHHLWGEFMYDLLAALEAPETDKPGKHSPAFMPFILRLPSKLPSTIKQADHCWDN